MIMANCDICGKESRLMTAMIEGVELNVCRDCGKHGRILRIAKPVQKPAKVKKEEKEVLQLIVNDYDKIIRKAREKTGLSQENFAKKINEKESIIQKLETKQFKPSIPMAQKLEKILGIKLIEQVEVEKEKKTEKRTTDKLTMGDLIKLK